MDLGVVLEQSGGRWEISGQKRAQTIQKMDTVQLVAGGSGKIGYGGGAGSGWHGVGEDGGGRKWDGSKKGYFDCSLT